MITHSTMSSGGVSRLKATASGGEYNFSLVFQVLDLFPLFVFVLSILIINAHSMHPR